MTEAPSTDHTSTSGAPKDRRRPRRAGTPKLKVAPGTTAAATYVNSQTPTRALYYSRTRAQRRRGCGCNGNGSDGVVPPST